MQKNQIETLQKFDHSFKVSQIAGVDEVGRGPLAGPVVCAAVILPKSYSFTYLNDSKKLTEKQRIIAFSEIKTKAISYSIVEVSHHIIDEINILNATKKGMCEAITSLKTTPELVLVDGNQKIDVPYPQETVVKGDGKSASIAAASILAKVYRDELMKNFANKYPNYKFESNKGYGSKAHRDAIKAYGACEIHRRSFLKNIMNEVEQLSFL